MLRASLGKVVHTVKRAGTYAAKVPPRELHKIAVHVRAVDGTHKDIKSPFLQNIFTVDTAVQNNTKLVSGQYIGKLQNW